MATVTKEMRISELLEVSSGLEPILRNHGVGCMGCPSRHNKTLEDIAMGHGMDADAMVNEMNEYLKAQGA